MAFQIRRAHRFFSPPQDHIAFRISNRESKKIVPCTLSGSHKGAGHDDNK
jgi:hypothetical protein